MRRGEAVVVVVDVRVRTRRASEDSIAGEIGCRLLLLVWVVVLDGRVERGVWLLLSKSIE